MPTQFAEPFGIAWYRPEQWELMLTLIPDPEVFPPTHGQWLAKAMQLERDFAQIGIRTVRIDVELKALLEWAARENLPPDGKARATYASQRTQAGQYL